MFLSGTPGVSIGLVGIPSGKQLTKDPQTRRRLCRGARIALGMTMFRRLISLAWVAWTTAAFAPQPLMQNQAALTRGARASPALDLCMCSPTRGDRRDFLGRSAALPAGLALLAAGPVDALTPAPKGTKIVVFGGNGFVGSRVAQQLAEAGAKVVSVSRSGAPPAWASGQEWVNSVSWQKGDPNEEDWSDALAGCAAVVSCVGVIGGSDANMQEGNGNTNVAIAEAAAAAGVPRIVYVSVSNAVRDAVGGFALKGYFKGKEEAEASIKAAFPKNAVILAPTFIYGGSEFSATPPRVAQGYGRCLHFVLRQTPTHAHTSTDTRHACCDDSNPLPLKLTLSTVWWKARSRCPRRGLWLEVSCKPPKDRFKSEVAPQYSRSAACSELEPRETFQSEASLTCCAWPVLPGVLGLALLPPVSVDSIAAAAGGAALNRVKAGRLDGTDAINAAATAAAQ